MEAPPNLPISAWTYESFELKSPNGKHTAKLSDLSEFGMGSPTTGRLNVEGYELDSANPSIVWSTDSRFLAVPVFTKDRMFRIMVLDVEAHRTRMFPGEWMVLQMVSLEGTILKAISSPKYDPVQLELDISTLNWESK